MPVFEAHIPRGRFSAEEKRALADAFSRSLVDALGVPADDRFVILTEHGPDELFIHPTFMDMERDPTSAMIVTVMIGARRPIEDKRKLVAAITRLVVGAVGVTPDDVFITLVPVPNENFSFRRGELQLAEGGPKW
ncbi:phenylpyruvate tautomerase PptA (4-oxalocrotonate tautomerase family) [Sphingobium sp. B1D7B]|uniref:tautomerase family protein n=1 Tax=Sphingobium sp. B1D7B TaxID=2940578 RepID=UPI002223F8AE|nr:tautomerase family protein [Sphingobium sp. B1D7B]MCW2406838.1 phenylpyruvate tautomerase PptA (4-oxalocrotonate tautomerase family) [Sphingobium sp. B1D7B]